MRRALVVLVLAAACLGPRIHEIVPQRTPLDCAVASLAMLAGKTYDETDRARLALGIEIGTVGMYPDDIVRVAAMLGVTLTRIATTAAPLSDEGILIVTLRGGDIHAVYLSRGDVYDPLERWPVPYSMAQMSWRSVVMFLKRVN